MCHMQNREIWPAIGKMERLNTGIQKDRAVRTVLAVLIGSLVPTNRTVHTAVAALMCFLVPINDFLNIGVYLKMSVIGSCTNPSNGKLGFLGGLKVCLSSLHVYLLMERGN